MFAFLCEQPAHPHGYGYGYGWKDGNMAYSSSSSSSSMFTDEAPIKTWKTPKTPKKLHAKQNKKLSVFVNPDNGLVAFVFHNTVIAIMKLTETPNGEIVASIKLQTGGFKTLSTLLALNKILGGTRFTILQDVSNTERWYLCYDEVGVEFTEEMSVNNINFDEILKILGNFHDKEFIDVGTL